MAISVRCKSLEKESTCAATQIVPVLPTGESGWTVPAEGAVLIGTSRHEGMYGKFVQPLVMLLDSQKVAIYWKAVLESCGASLMQLEIRQLQATLERERAAASRAREATALITKQQELALKENEGSKRTLLVSHIYRAVNRISTTSRSAARTFRRMCL